MNTSSRNAQLFASHNAVGAVGTWKNSREGSEESHWDSNKNQITEDGLEITTIWWTDFIHQIVVSVRYYYCYLNYDYLVTSTK